MGREVEGSEPAGLAGDGEEAITIRGDFFIIQLKMGFQLQKCSSVSWVDDKIMKESSAKPTR